MLTIKNKIKYNYKNFILSKQKFFLSISLRLIAAYSFLFCLFTIFKYHPLREPIWLPIMFVILLTFSIVITTFQDHAYKGYIQKKNKIIQEYKEIMLKNSEDKFTINEIYNMLPQYLKDDFIEALYDYNCERSFYESTKQEDTCYK
ncbi:hypothetical protein EDM57_04250 [Brevibacillus gelatini]|uniref:Uncharacterized protein n=1 Tax=Brevibacillus gelatini TaxID=1655277 RepID=A0A3M8B7L6_9BACL|nr:hypothetical protein [Brevibacillus gelatini]RNB59360.1 hypothetical protein EDM57_04250 [Brevibacillus gelatini]